MEETESAECGSLINMSAEETGPGAPGHEAVTNGHVKNEENDIEVSSPFSPTTNYWSVLEGPNTPLLLSLVPGPSKSQGKQAKSRSDRPAVCRTSGRDHRRYYHAYWRNEYLMDYDPERDGMICMVCGSSLATLKLSTIKRHIRQKHPESLLWSEADKQVVRSSWESHFSKKRVCPGTGDAVLPKAELLDCSRLSAGEPDGQRQKPESPSHGSADSPNESPAPDDPQKSLLETLERYLNDSLHAWFRQEFLMEYEAEAGQLQCMVCSRRLPSLHLDHLKTHVLGLHPQSLVFSAEEKHCILTSWDKRQEPESLSKESAAIPKASVKEENRDCRKRRRGTLRDGPARMWRLDYLVSYGPDGSDVRCMVCSQALPAAKVSCYRLHIQDCHPETANLSQKERKVLAEAWGRGQGGGEEANVQEPAVEAEADASVTAPAGGSKTDDSAGQGSAPAPLTKGTTGRHSHYPGKDQRRNYQARWHTEYLMEYDCQRHGLVCMVCGAPLATLKLSTIKRHIQQVHPHSMHLGPEERREVVLAYNQSALRLVHAGDHGQPGDPDRTGAASEADVPAETRSEAGEACSSV